MGSKKKKDKERNGERKKHKRERKNRENSDGSKRSRDRKDEDYDKERKRRKEDEDDELLSYALDNDQDASYCSSEKDVKSTSGDKSLSIEETNKIRAKLGLKLLAVENVVADEPKNRDEEFVHAPPVNMLEKANQEKYKEKLKEIREKREMHKKLQKVKKLAESDSGDDNAMSWVRKVRKKEVEKIMAERRAKLLEEMDDEFGVGELVDNVMRKKPKEYTAKDLKGLTVEHSAAMIREGKAVVLTLKDSGVLDDSEDILMNVNIVDSEKAEKNVELRKKKPGYQAYEEFDETGQIKVQGMLSKYDEEIDGEKKKTFSLSHGGNVNLSREQELQNIRDRLHNQALSLAMPEPKTISEYYTEEEMLKFKKPKKRRKIKKRETLKADDLIPLETDENADHGFRGSNVIANKSSKVYKESAMEDLMEWQMGDPEDAEIRGPEINEHEPLFEDDDAQLELQLALERSRRSKLKKENMGPEKVVIALTSMSNKSNANAEGSIVLDSTSEFCRTLGEIPTYGSSGNRPEVEEAADENMNIEGEDEEQGGWEIVKQEENKMDDSNKEPVKQDANVLDDEPVLGMGVGAALKLVQKKGMIEGDRTKERKFAGGLALPETVKIIDEEKMRDEEREKLRERGRDRDRDRDRYNPNAFKEKAGYKPDVKLEYVDEHGREMNPKEAFRHLSHKFHGKIPGKLKTEKRQKKVSEDMALKKMNAGDTPLNTVALFSEKQKQGQTPYLILSGGGQTFSSGPTMSKTK